MARKKDIKKEKEKDLKEQLARALADYDNLRKRVEKEKDVLEQLIGIKILTRMFPVYDMLFEAQEHLKDQGIAMIVVEFEKLLRDEGIEKIRVEKGQQFNENIHEAVEAVSGGKKGEIAEEVLTGWKFIGSNQAIRPAKVKVYK
ncbi:nucleotide exchange factor GrpE [Candidatus Woesebacteria bacterium RIFCSPLOWO2_01_FULL_39_61]|uniref:Protein GrpE n=1 Tax=Candidatus Woesebacteria bacterium RIFCSPHIGHO2_02_FULL_39_13 TaxID=1802505 RepID=A0A1F7Z393_9BACT|nr:MAG: nucleotide exchange factor GrpE [Candidatus Woesebacteria bacterium RIFCSPHIGHO2_01_FULL_39_95]OGM33559.1 MAG: nucleotide exchange factor GrpE [Candidatus Woesebacteria bacterium RIFCSPHIGHO2_02_FULL_39_13]OGM36711.1 MAG: nucleotide exchange factor GrpE [Candidatus Woesebacteria bacterium RIFCSPHIGHO2_12_FULL_40_20]OGM66189.1 MAG: nucleotide exchange factor GrpE [Candidatus Woesebacteria bacterium RIFCSPLOWO2_01_FULL_39_61]OGM71684.1 MAG: nucleotide exchange factor GrpE [Candidatus Woes